MIRFSSLQATAAADPALSLRLCFAQGDTVGGGVQGCPDWNENGLPRARVDIWSAEVAGGPRAAFGME